MKLNIVMVEPEIPQNTGNVARTCAATGARLHLVGPMGFKIDDKKLKRAGLDYWHFLGIKYYENLDDFFDKNKGCRFFCLSSKAPRSYADAEFRDGDFLVFGKESHGLPEPLLKEHYDNTLRIPMWQNLRSLNLSNSVALTLYEALRQTGFSDLNPEGHLTGRPD